MNKANQNTCPQTNELLNTDTPTTDVCLPHADNGGTCAAIQCNWYER
jgi:hypothetical protein